MNKKTEKINPIDYFEYLIVEHSELGDSTVKRQELYKECKVEYSDDVKTCFEVNALMFRPSRTKQKQELRKEIDEYMKE